jgi:hypothetical protein
VTRQARPQGRPRLRPTQGAAGRGARGARAKCQMQPSFHSSCAVCQTAIDCCPRNSECLEEFADIRWFRCQCKLSCPGSRTSGARTASLPLAAFGSTSVLGSLTPEPPPLVALAVPPLRCPLCYWRLRSVAPVGFARLAAAVSSGGGQQRCPPRQFLRGVHGGTQSSAASPGELRRHRAACAHR